MEDTAITKTWIKVSCKCVSNVYLIQKRQKEEKTQVVGIKQNKQCKNLFLCTFNVVNLFLFCSEQLKLTISSLYQLILSFIPLFLLLYKLISSFIPLFLLYINSFTHFIFQSEYFSCSLSLAVRQHSRTVLVHLSTSNGTPPFSSPGVRNTATH